MGRWSYSGRQEADSLKQVRSAFLKKHGYFSSDWKYGKLTWSWNGEPAGNISIQSFLSDYEQYIKLIYTRTDRDTQEKKDFDYKIPLNTTPCYFGGKRYWFICPWFANGVYCGRRVGVLYLRGDYFACRHCYNLTYNSRNLSGYAKVAGQVISFPELDELEAGVTTKFYARKMTRRYKKYLKKRDKSLFQLKVMANIYGDF